MVKSKVNNPLKFHIPPLPGTVKLHIVVGMLKSYTLDQIIPGLIEHGYSPVLKYSQGKELGLFLVLKEVEASDAEAESVKDALWSELETLIEAFPGLDEAISVQYRRELACAA